MTVWGRLETLEHLGYYLGTCFGHWGEGMEVFDWGNMLGELEHFRGDSMGNN